MTELFNILEILVLGALGGIGGAICHHFLYRKETEVIDDLIKENMKLKSENTDLNVALRQKFTNEMGTEKWDCCTPSTDLALKRALESIQNILKKNLGP